MGFGGTFRDIFRSNPAAGDVHMPGVFGGKKPRRRRPPPDQGDAIKGDYRTLYVYRQLTNAATVARWAKAQGFASTLGDAMHVTIAFSKIPVDWFAAGADWSSNQDGKLEIPAGGPRTVERFGEAVVLRFASEALQYRWQRFLDIGAGWAHPDFAPHITISWAAPDVDLDIIDPYDGPLVFGPEHFEEIDEDWRDTVTEKQMEDAEVLKAMFGKAGARHSRADQSMLQQIHDHAVGLGAKCEDDEPATKGGRGLPEPLTIVAKSGDDERMVYGWASVWSVKGATYEDTQGDVLSAETMEKAATDFMVDQRVAMSMHQRNADGGIDAGMVKGVVVHSFPLTDALMKALGLECDREGWIVGVKIFDDATWSDVKSGKLKAFSIGGKGYRETV